ncbi:SPFH domain-containing protein, partial [Myxococcota bacterium]|nr:SPFH domain-containing protein [Myxococcota bacterium]MBU1898814.1 SPFH domain-containing protein [Myxococcota bacterium]
MRLGEIQATARAEVGLTSARRTSWLLALLSVLGFAWLHGVGVGALLAGEVVVIDGPRPRVITRGGLFFYAPLIEGVTRVSAGARRLSLDLRARLEGGVEARIEGITLRARLIPASAARYLSLGADEARRALILKAMAQAAISEQLASLKPRQLKAALPARLERAQGQLNARLSAYGLEAELLYLGEARTPLDDLIRQVEAATAQIDALQQQRRRYEEEAIRAVEVINREASAAAAVAEAKARQRRAEAKTREAQAQAEVARAAAA